MKTPKDVVRIARMAFKSGRTNSREFRQNQLENLWKMIDDNERQILDVLKADFHKGVLESVLTEIIYTKSEIQFLMTSLKKLMKPARVTKPFVNIMDEAFIYNDPYGVALVITSWNYPIQGPLVPLAGAIAGGNTVIVKPSEMAKASEHFLAEQIPKYLDNECYQVICGGIPETTELLKEKLDYIFFIGSTRVGKIIHAAANKHLVPVTLELGGKCPLYIDYDVDMNMVTSRVLWGKYLNAGQTCVAPDYVMCSNKAQTKFLAQAKRILREWYGKDPVESEDFARIINDANYKRLSMLLKSGNIAVGGRTDAKIRYIEPTIMVDVKPTDEIMKEEIFGPILPIISGIERVRDAIAIIKSKPPPLALYMFTNNRPTVNALLRETSSGGVCINDVVMHVSVPTLPFGGVGLSGMGAYHGRTTFDTFVHKRSVLKRTLNKFEEMMQTVKYPPRTKKKVDRLKEMVRVMEHEVP